MSGVQLQTIYRDSNTVSRCFHRFRTVEFAVWDVLHQFAITFPPRRERLFRSGGNCGLELIGSNGPISKTAVQLAVVCGHTWGRRRSRSGNKGRFAIEPA